MSAGCEDVGGAAYCGDLCPRTCATQMINDPAADANGLLPCEGIGEDFARLTRTGPSCCGALNVHAPQCTRRARAPGWPYLLLPYSASKSPRHGIREGYSGASPNFRNTSARRLRPARPAMPHRRPSRGRHPVPRQVPAMRSGVQNAVHDRDERLGNPRSVVDQNQAEQMGVGDLESGPLPHCDHPRPTRRVR